MPRHQPAGSLQLQGTGPKKLAASRDLPHHYRAYRFRLSGRPPAPQSERHWHQPCGNAGGAYFRCVCRSGQPGRLLYSLRPVFGRYVLLHHGETGEKNHSLEGPDHDRMYVAPDVFYL